jgi:hypothetical protein
VKQAGSWCALSQVALMGVVGSAVSAMDANRGVAGIARCGLVFLRILADNEYDKVMCAMKRDCV